MFYRTIVTLYPICDASTSGYRESRAHGWRPEAGPGPRETMRPGPPGIPTLGYPRGRRRERRPNRRSGLAAWTLATGAFAAGALYLDAFGLPCHGSTRHGHFQDA